MKNSTAITASSPITFMPLSEISNPIALLQEPNDSFLVKVNKNKSITAKLNACGIKRAATFHPKSGKTVDYISH